MNESIQENTEHMVVAPEFRFPFTQILTFKHLPSLVTILRDIQDLSPSFKM